MGHSRYISLLRVWAVTLAALLFGPASVSLGQSMGGAFMPWQNPPPTGGVATDPTNPAGFTVLVDDDLNPLTPPVAYNLGAQAPALAGASEYRISPTGTFLFVLDSNVGGTGPSSFWFAELDGVGGVAVLHGPVSVANVPVSERLSGPHFYDIGSPFDVQQIAVMILGPPDGSNTRAAIFDLNTPGLSGQAFVPLSAGLNLPGAFAPSGTDLVIQNGLSDGDTTRFFYTVIDVCTGGMFGASSNVQVSSGQQASFRVEVVGDGTVNVIGEVPGQPAVFFNNKADCLDMTMPPDTGACCIGSSCFDGVTAADCAGGAFFANMTCAQACPTPALQVVNSGPSTAFAPSQITYSTTVRNTGNADATGVRMTANLPARLDFVSATGGGTFNPFQQWVEWSFGTVAAGSSVTVTATFEALCNDTGTVTYSPRADAANAFPSVGNTIQTSISFPPAPPLTMSIVSTADAGEPVLQGGTITHTFTITNPTSEDAVDVSVPGSNQDINYGSDVSFVETIDAGSGFFDVDPFGFPGIRWTGDIPAGGSETFSFRTRVDCVRPGFGGMGGQDVTLGGNAGQSIFARNACLLPVAEAIPNSVSTAPPARVQIEIIELTPGTFGPLDPSGPFVGPTGLRAARAGSEVEVRAVIENVQGAPLSGVSIEHMWFGPIMDPPFVGTVPAGVTYDAASTSVLFSGDLMTGERVEYRFRARLTEGGCEPLQIVRGNVGSGCTGNVLVGFDSPAIVPVPDYASQPAFYGIDVIGGLYRYEGIGGDPLGIFCPFNEVFFFLGGTSSGVYFVEGFPSFVVDPGTPSVRIFDGAVGMIGIDDPANAVIAVTGPGQLSRVFADETSQLVIDEPAPTVGFSGAASAIPEAMMLIENFGLMVSVIDPTGTLPLTEADIVDRMPAPSLSYPYGSMLGDQRDNRVVRLVPAGEDILALVRTTFSSSTTFSGTQIYGVVRYDSRTRQMTVIEAELAVSQFGTLVPIPASADLLITDELNSVEESPTGELLLSGRNGGYVFDPATRIALRTASAPTARGFGGVAASPGMTSPGTPCSPADVASPLGVLNVGDINAFVSAFLAGDPLSDFAAPMGIFNSSDVNAFVAAFLAGCP